MATTWDPPAYPHHRSSDRRASPLTAPTAAEREAQGAPRARRAALPVGPLPGSPRSRAHLGWPEALPPDRTPPLLREPQPSPQRSPSPEQSRPPVPKREPQQGRSAGATRQVTSYSTLAPYSAPEPKPLVAGHRPIRLLDRRWCLSVT